MIDVNNFHQNTIGKFRCIKKLPTNVTKLECNSSSEYYISNDGLTLYRVSNHWSLSECEFIASCIWQLLDTKGKTNYHKTRIGAIKFKNLTPITINLSHRISISGKQIIDDRGNTNLKKVEKALKSSMAKL